MTVTQNILLMLNALILSRKINLIIFVYSVYFCAYMCHKWLMMILYNKTKSIVLHNVQMECRVLLAFNTRSIPHNVHDLKNSHPPAANQWPSQ